MGHTDVHEPGGYEGQEQYYYSHELYGAGTKGQSENQWVLMQQGYGAPGQNYHVSDSTNLPMYRPPYGHFNQDGRGWHYIPDYGNPYNKGPESYKPESKDDNNNNNNQ